MKELKAINWILENKEVLVKYKTKINAPAREFIILREEQFKTVEKIKNIIANNVEKFDYLNAFHDGKEDDVIIISQIRRILGTYQDNIFNLSSKEKDDIFDIFHVAKNYFAIKILNWNAQPYNISEVHAYIKE